MYERALVIKKVLIINKTYGGGVGLSSHQLANVLNCTPQTIHNTVNKWGEQIGIGFVLETMKNGVDRKVFYAVDTSLYHPIFEGVMK